MKDEPKKTRKQRMELEVPILEEYENGNGRFMSRQRMHEIRSSILRKLSLELPGEQPSTSLTG